MCGIAGIHVFKDENMPKYSKMERAVDVMLAAIDHRGGDATGIVAIADGDITHQRASCNAAEFYKERRAIPFYSADILLHTRMATQGSAAFPENNHPVKRGSVYVVHNGHIWNDTEIFRRTNRERFGQVDSEAIAALIAKYGIMNTHKAMEEITGAAAIGVVDDTRPGLMALARGASSPLMFYRNENIAVFGSTKEAVKRGWDILYGSPPKDKKIWEVPEGTAIYLDADMQTKRFEVDDLYGYYRTQNAHRRIHTTYVSTPNSNSYDSQAWGDDELYETNVLILCAHGIDKLDCEICNPDDTEGSFLPAVRTPIETESGFVMRSGESGAWIEAVRCELCDLFFPVEELVEIEDWDDKWQFCSKCLEELSEVVSDEGHDNVRSYREEDYDTYGIHRTPLSENSAAYTFQD